MKLRSLPLSGYFALLFCVLPCAILLLTACGKQGAESTSPTPAKPIVSTFVGDADCKECHKKEIEAHQNTRHAHALRLVNDESMKGDMPAAGDLAGTPFQWEKLPNGYGFGLANEASRPMHLAFGSGKSGIAFLAAMGNEGMAEAHLSYYPPLRKWFVTPGQASLPPNTPGNLIKREGALQCLGCHTSTVPENTLLPEEKLLGVRCESCHGAGSIHIDAMRRKDKAADNYEKMGTWGAGKLNDACGRCHRTAKDVETKSLDRTLTDKFQGFGISQSKCFQKSGDKLSCIVCHDPHTDTPQKSSPYIAACLRCHSVGGSSTTAKPALMQSKICPVNAKDDCIKCHMPLRSRPLFEGSPRRIADHFIHIERNKDKPQ